MTNEQSKIFPLEKILTVSLADYIGFSETTILRSDYDLIGVNVCSDAEDINEKFASKVPEGTKVVVDYRAVVSQGHYGHMGVASGTALVSKTRGKQ